MKSIALFASLLAAGAAVASSVSSSTTFGVLKIPSRNAQTVVSVPWVAAGSGNDVKVKDFVKTTGMTEGDQLYLYNTTGVNAGKFTGWVLDNGAWVAAKEVSDGDPDTVDTPADFGSTQVVQNENATIAQGSALVIVRTAENITDDIYIYGQYKTDSLTNFPVGYSTSAKFTTLFAPINLTGSAIHLNDQKNGSSQYLSWTNAKKGDKIRLQDANGNVVTYTYTTGGNWSYSNSDKLGLTGTLQPGQGAWYVACADAERTAAPYCTIATSSAATAE